MDTSRFAALVARHEQGLTVYGPFASRVDARLGTEWLGSTDPRVVATRPIALYPPDSDPLSTTDESQRGEVVRLPDEIASLMAAHREDATVDDASAVAVLVVLAAPEHPALLVGPFDSSADARTWHGRAGRTGGTHTAECYLLPVRRSDLCVQEPPGETGLPQATSVVLLDTEDDSVVYGPFDTGMDAALYWHDVTRVLTITNVRHVHICELAPPTDTAVPATAGENMSADKRVRGWGRAADRTGARRAEAYRPVHRRTRRANLEHHARLGRHDSASDLCAMTAVDGCRWVRP
jgi:hypothetical protein